MFLRFFGPPGMAYPQHRPEVDAFDDATRKGAVLSSTAAIKDIAAPADAKYANYKPEFTEEEIRAAFRFIDLDHNDVNLPSVELMISIHVSLSLSVQRRFVTYWCVWESSSPTKRST